MSEQFVTKADLREATDELARLTKADIREAVDELARHTKADIREAMDEQARQTKADIRELARLLEHHSESLQREVHDRIEGLQQEMHSGFDRIDSSVRRHSGMITSGTFAISTLTKTVSRLENQMRKRDVEVRGLKQRIQKLERKKSA